MIRQQLNRFMTGRYGMDALNAFLLLSFFVLNLVFLVADLLFFRLLVLALLAIALLRMYSLDIPRRQAENTRFLQFIRPITQKLHTLHTRIHDREHRYFKCPNCGQQMRVPRGKGRITVHCRTCGATFEEKS